MLKEPISKDEIFTAGRFVYQSTRLDVTAALVDVTRVSLTSFKKEFIKRGQSKGVRPQRTLLPREVDGFYMLLLDVEDITERIYGGTLTKAEHQEAYDELLSIFRPQFLKSIPVNIRVSSSWFTPSTPKHNPYNEEFAAALQMYFREHVVPIKEFFDVENFDEEATLWYLRGYVRERHSAQS